MQFAFNTRYPGDDNADTTNRSERTIHLSNGQVAFRFPPSGQKARGSKARETSFPGLGRFYFTHRKFLLGLEAGDIRANSGALSCIRNDHHT